MMALPPTAWGYFLQNAVPASLVLHKQILSTHLLRLKIWRAEADKVSGIQCRAPRMDEWRDQCCDTWRTWICRASCCILSRRLDFQNVSRFVQVLDKGMAGEAGKCLNSCSYCCQDSRCPSAVTKHTYSTATVGLQGAAEDSYTMTNVFLIALLTFGGVLIQKNPNIWQRPWI